MQIWQALRSLNASRRCGCFVKLDSASFQSWGSQIEDASISWTPACPWTQVCCPGIWASCWFRERRLAHSRSALPPVTCLSFFDSPGAFGSSFWCSYRMCWRWRLSSHASSNSYNRCLGDSCCSAHTRLCLSLYENSASYLYISSTYVRLAAEIMSACACFDAHLCSWLRGPSGVRRSIPD